MADHNPNLWAPWRMEYIRSLDEAAGAEAKAFGGCFLCQYAAEPEQDAVHHVICRGDHCFMVLNRFPYSNGHLMVAPYRHCGDPTDLADEIVVAMARMTRDAVTALRHAVSAQGFNIGTNVGRCAGAGLPDHVHQHVVPRWGGDTNYMSVLGGVRVIPDALDAVYATLKDTVARLGLGG